MIGQTYSTERQLNKADSFDAEPHRTDLDLSVTNVIVLFNIYDKGDDFNFGKR